MIINVWQSEQEDIYSELTPEEIKNMLLEQYSAYFASAENPVIYYAKEIDLAQQQGRELKEEWGKQQFTDKVTDILNNINSGDRMKRIKTQIETALTLCENQLTELLEDHQIEAMKQAERTELSEINKIRRQLGKAKQLATGEIKQTAAKAANDVLEMVIEASNSFIENKMQGTNFDALLRKRSTEKLKKEFEDDYIRIHNGWLDEIVKEYSDNVENVLEGIYIDFSLDSEVVTASKKINITSSDLDAFIAGLSDVMSKDIQTRMISTFFDLYRYFTLQYSANICSIFQNRSEH